MIDKSLNDHSNNGEAMKHDNNGISNLSDQQCSACSGETPALTASEAEKLIAELHDDWILDADGSALLRRFKVKGFAKAVYLSNLCAWLADNEGHHPDVCYGWGYCHVTLTTHELNGLSQNDFILAAKLDKLVA